MTVREPFRIEEDEPTTQPDIIFKIERAASDIRAMEKAIKACNAEQFGTIIVQSKNGGQSLRFPVPVALRDQIARLLLGEMQACLGQYRAELKNLADELLTNNHAKPLPCGWQRFTQALPGTSFSWWQLLARH